MRHGGEIQDGIQEELDFRAEKACRINGGS
jgi:hypothetical protein